MIRADKAWLENLLAVSQLINSSLELNEVMSLILDGLQRVIPYDSATIQRMTSKGLQIVACRGLPNADQLINRTFPPSESYPNYRVWQQKKAHIEADMQTTYQSRRVRGWLGVPLLYQNKAIGVLTLDSHTPNFYTEEDAHVTTIFANQAAVAMENARLYAKEAKRARTLQALLEVEQEITQTITTQSKVLLNKIAGTACQVTGADCAVIYPYLAESGKYDLANLSAFGLHGKLTQQDKKRLIDGDGISSLVLQKGRVIIHDTAQDDPRLLQHKFIKREQIEAFIGIRLESTEPVGILFVNYRRPHKWHDEEMSLIELFASQAATAILNARLFGRTNERLERKIAALRSVGEINQLITATLDLEVVLSLILSKAQELVDVQHIALRLVDAESGDLVIQQSPSVSYTVLEPVRLSVGQGITGAAAQQKQPLIVDDVTQPPWRNIYLVSETPMRSQMVVPLMIDNECIGTLNFEHPQPGYFDADKCEIIEALTDQAAIAIQNARRYDELEQTKDDLAVAEAVAWIGLFGSSWVQGLTQKTSAMRNYLAVLAEYIAPGSEAEDLLIRIQEILRAVQGIPLAQTLPNKPTKATTTDLDTALAAQLERWCRNHSNVILETRLNCAGWQAHIDEEWLEVAMEKLINNALRAMPEGGRLTIVSQPLKTRVEIKISDTGVGLPEKIRPYFLRKQIPRDFTSAGGSGIGTLIARYIFRTFEGDLELLWSEPGQGTALRVTLPATRSNEVPEK